MEFLSLCVLCIWPETQIWDPIEATKETRNPVAVYRAPSTNVYTNRNRGCSTYFPAADPEEETQHIGLLALLKLFDVLKGTHFVCKSKESTISKAVN
jgi:hypothetical protein